MSIPGKKQQTGNGGQPCKELRCDIQQAKTLNEGIMKGNVDEIKELLKSQSREETSAVIRGAFDGNCYQLLKLLELTHPIRFAFNLMHTLEKNPHARTHENLSSLLKLINLLPHNEVEKILSKMSAELRTTVQHIHYRRDGQSLDIKGLDMFRMDMLKQRMYYQEKVDRNRTKNQDRLTVLYYSLPNESLTTPLLPSMEDSSLVASCYSSAYADVQEATSRSDDYVYEPLIKSSIDKRINVLSLNRGEQGRFTQKNVGLIKLQKEAKKESRRRNKNNKRESFVQQGCEKEKLRKQIAFPFVTLLSTKNKIDYQPFIYIAELSILKKIKNRIIANAVKIMDGLINRVFNIKKNLGRVINAIKDSNVAKMIKETIVLKKEQLKERLTRKIKNIQKRIKKPPERSLLFILGIFSILKRIKKSILGRLLTIAGLKK